jgi:hypothetical protein
MGFLFYRPGESQRVPAELAYAFERPPITHQVIANGPDGGGGIIFAGGIYHDRTNRVGVYHDQQTWQKIPGGNLWLGWYRDELPGPTDLARSKMVAGREVLLGDGNQWTVPVAIAFVDGSDGLLHRQNMLPAKMAIGDDGAWTVGDVVPNYAALYEVAKSWWDRDDGVTIADATNWCCTALATNYRISAVEASVLGLFDTETYKQILDVVIDFETLARRQTEKKSERSATLNTPVGSVD